jgi:mono/diheme cytochrome c family protein
MRKLWMMALLAACVAGSSAYAADKPDLARGKALLEKNCESCHVSMYGGDGSEIYRRPNRIVKNLNQLKARVEGCNANTNAGWFPDDEADVIAYLNRTFYHFKE